MADEAFVVEAGVLAVGASFPLGVDVQLHFFGLVVQPVLLHGHLRVAQQVLFLGQLRLGVQYLQVEVGVGQPQDDVSFLHLRAFFHHLLPHDAAFFGAELYDGDGLHLSVDADVVIELAVAHLGNVEGLSVHFQGGGMVAEQHPCQQGQQQCAARDVGQVLFLDPFFLL